MNEFYGPRIEQKLITKVCDVLNVVPGDYGSDKYKAVEAVQLMNLENNLSYSFSRNIKKYHEKHNHGSQWQTSSKGN